MSNVDIDDGFDWCQAYRQLRDAYQAIVSEGGLRRVRVRNGEHERDTEFSPANITALKEAMLEAQRKCLASVNGGLPSRCAIGIGPSRIPRRIY